MVGNNHSLTRRNVIRSVAGIGSLSTIPLAASATGAADSGERIRYYEIDDDGDLVYVGPDHGEDNYLSKAVSGFNEAKEEGKSDSKRKTVESPSSRSSRPNPSLPSRA